METKFTPQAMRRVMVQFTGAEVRGISYRGQAWFDITWTNLGPYLECCVECESRWLFAYREDRFHQDASKSAREKLGTVMHAAALAWVTANRPAFETAEIERLEGLLDDATATARKAQAALDAAQSAHADARIALQSFKNSLGE